MKHGQDWRFSPLVRTVGLGATFVGMRRAIVSVIVVTAAVMSIVLGCGSDAAPIDDDADVGATSKPSKADGSAGTDPDAATADGSPTEERDATTEVDAGAQLGGACTPNQPSCGTFGPYAGWCYNGESSTMYARCTFDCWKLNRGGGPGAPLYIDDPDKKALCESLGGVCGPPEPTKIQVCLVP